MNDMEVYFSDAEQAKRIVEAARRTVERIYREQAIGNRFHWVLLDELEHALAEAGQHPFQTVGDLKPERARSYGSA